MSCPNKHNDICAKPGACLAPYCYEKPVNVERTQADEIAFLKNRIAVLEDVCKQKHEQVIEHMRQIAELKANLKRATFAMNHFDGNPWKAELINELECSGIYKSAHENAPEKALTDAINWNVDVALDPAVSSDAKKLVDKTVASCVEIINEYMADPDEVDLDKEYYRGYNIALKTVSNAITEYFAGPKNAVDDVDDLDFV